MLGRRLRAEDLVRSMRRRRDPHAHAALESDKSSLCSPAPSAAAGAAATAELEPAGLSGDGDGDGGDAPYSLAKAPASASSAAAAPRSCEAPSSFGMLAAARSGRQGRRGSAPFASGAFRAGDADASSVEMLSVEAQRVGSSSGPSSCSQTPVAGCSPAVTPSGLRRDDTQTPTAAEQQRRQLQPPAMTPCSSAPDIARSQSRGGNGAATAPIIYGYGRGDGSLSPTAALELARSATASPAP